MNDPKQLIEECKSHLRDKTTHKQQYKTDIRKLITALEQALSISDVVGQSEQLKCEDCKNPLPKGMKHKCYECWDDIYFPK